MTHKELRQFEPIFGEPAQANLKGIGSCPSGQTAGFSIQEDDELLPERVKLSWFSKISGNYMFVNSMGMRTKIRKQSDLAGLMAAGKASIIHDEQYPLIHRALEAIRRMLGSDNHATA